jgi:cell division protein FtsL
MKTKKKIKDINEYRINKKNKYKKVVLKKILKFTIKLGCVSCVFIIILGCMYSYSEVSKLKYKIGELESILHNKTIERDNVQVEVDLLTRSRDIEKKANEKLGMDYPKENQIKYIEVDK